MQLTRTASLRLIKILCIIIVVGIIIAYAISRSLNYARGPHIEIYQPLNGSSTATSTMLILGRVQRINKLNINEKPVSIDEKGNFAETIIIFPGLNIITIDGKDQFNRSTETHLELVGTVDLPVHINSPVTSSTTPK